MPKLHRHELEEEVGDSEEMRAYEEEMAYLDNESDDIVDEIEASSWDYDDGYDYDYERDKSGIEAMRECIHDAMVTELRPLNQVALRPLNQVLTADYFRRRR